MATSQHLGHLRPTIGALGGEKAAGDSVILYHIFMQSGSEIK